MITRHNTARGVALAMAAGSVVGVAFAQQSPEPIPQPGPVVVCFAPGTDPGYMARVNQLVDLRNQAFFGQDYYLNGSWSSPGTPRTLTWSFVPDGLQISGGVGEAAAPSNLFATLDSAYASQGGRATWVNRFQQVFDRWHALTGLTYQRVTVNGNDWDDGAAWGSAGAANLRGDVRISMHLIDGSSNILAYCNFPPSGDMVLDSGDASLFASAANSNRFLRNVVAHEHGHGIGLLHVCTNNSNILMEPFIDTSYDGPRQDDTRGGQALYGDPMEPNNTAATAKPLGALATGTTLNLGAVPAPVSGTSDVNSALLSIEGSGMVDWYSFTITQSMVATVTVTPVGSTYDMAQQGSSGCPASGSPMNALAAANLGVDVYDSNGTTLIGTSNTAPAGQPEVLNVGLSGSGTRYVRVFSAAGQTSAQAYKISVSAASPCPVFQTQPQGQSLCEGPAVLLSVSVAGSPTPTLQWRKDQQNIPGATGANLILNPTVEGQSGTYDCVATNSCGSATSNPAVVTIGRAPEIVQQPQNVTVPLGSPASFSVVLSNITPETYQWRHDGATIALANGPTYNIQSVTQDDVGTYDCLIFSSCGNATSLAATLTIGTGNQCYANCDGSTTQPILNVNDFICFQGKYAAGDPYANCDGSTTQPILNVNDFICFQQKYAQGCP